VGFRREAHGRHDRLALVAAVRPDLELIDRRQHGAGLHSWRAEGVHHQPPRQASHQVGREGAGLEPFWHRHHLSHKGLGQLLLAHLPRSGFGEGLVPGDREAPGRGLAGLDLDRLAAPFRHGWALRGRWAGARHELGAGEQRQQVLLHQGAEGGGLHRGLAAASVVAQDWPIFRPSGYLLTASTFNHTASGRRHHP
jgi:hypothetical protein